MQQGTRDGEIESQNTTKKRTQRVRRTKGQRANGEIERERERDSEIQVNTKARREIENEREGNGASSEDPLMPPKPYLHMLPQPTFLQGYDSGYDH